MAPEGTRKKVPTWKTGFYYIALKVNVLIICVSFDYEKKTVTLNEPFYPTGNYDVDIVEIRAYYKGVFGKIQSILRKIKLQKRVASNESSISAIEVIDYSSEDSSIV